MRKITNSLIAVSVVASFTVFVGLGTPQVIASGSSLGHRSCGWRVVPSAPVSAVEHQHWAYFSGNYRPEALAAVDAISPTNVWMIGNAIEHWNGKKWTVYNALRNAGDQQLNAIAALSSKNIWVVGGDSSYGGAGAGALINHWNGKRWTKVTAPTGDLLYAVGASTSRDVWAGGAMPVSDAEDSAYVDHWNGQEWVGTVLPPDANAFPNELSGIAPVSPSEVLVVGRNAYAAIWNGKQWTALNSPIFADAITAVSKTDAWAVGEGYPGVTEQWNGVSWSMVPLTLPKGWSASLESVSAAGPNDIWAVGQMAKYNSANRFVAERLIAVHWNGSKWTYHDKPSAKAGFSNLTGVSVLPNGDVWAVGSYGKAYGYAGKKLRPLIEHYRHC